MVNLRKRKRSTEGNPNPMVFLEVFANKEVIGTMVFKLFADVAPTYAENFRALCTGERGIGPITKTCLWYKGSYFIDSRGQPSSYVKGGDLSSPEGDCGESIYGNNFKYVTPKRRLGCDERGLLCMNIGDQYTLGSHFVITLEPDQSLDSLHVVFGKLIKGFEILEKIVCAQRCWSRVKVSQCGQYHGDDTEEARETLPKILTSKIPESKLLVYLTVHISYWSRRTMVFELYPEKAPLASENFRALCTGGKGCSPNTGHLSYYKFRYFHKKKGSSYVTGGTLEPGSDEGVESIYGPNFRVVETSDIDHYCGGLLSISRRDFKASSGSFIITLREDQSLDRSHIVFGKLLVGQDALEDLGRLCCHVQAKIVDSGIYHPGEEDIPRDVCSFDREEFQKPIESLHSPYSGGLDNDSELEKELEELRKELGEGWSWPIEDEKVEHWSWQIEDEKV